MGAFMLPWAAHLIDQVHLSQGERVLDLACGTGFVGRLAAARVGQHGEVTGLDVNPAMVAEARKVTGLEIVESSAEATGLPSAAFDVVLCQQGLQYFSDAAAVIDESVRLLRPNGRVAMSVWAGFERNPFRVAQLRAMASHLKPEDVDSFQRTTVTALGGMDGVARLFRDARLRDVEVREHQLDVLLPPMREYFPRLIAATPWAKAFAELSYAERFQSVRHMEAVGVPQPSGRGVSVPMSVVVVTAKAPGHAAAGRRRC